jgi:hypothetical protein
MLVVVTFAIDKRFGLVDKDKKTLEENRTVGRRKESLSTVMGTICDLVDDPGLGRLCACALKTFVIR